MDHISLEIDPGIGYKVKNLIVNLISHSYLPLGDSYNEKVNRVKDEVFKLLSGEPFRGVGESGSIMGSGLSDSLHRIVLHFSEEPSSDLADKIRNIKGVSNVRYVRSELEQVPNYI